MSLFFLNLKRGLKGAYTSIKSNFSEYLCFFFALILVQTLFGVVTVAFENGRNVERSVITGAGYTYHAVLSGVQQNDLNLLENAKFDAIKQNTSYFDFDASGGQCRITFLSDVVRARRLFESSLLMQMNAGGERVMLSTTPLYESEAAAGADLPVYFVLLLLLMLLSFGLLTALFRIRINHFKFTYSIYMAFGGDFRMLLSSAGYEMLLIVLLSLPVSLLLTYGVSALFYLPFGQTYAFYFAPIPVLFLCSLLCATLALVLPVRVLANGMPVQHMKAQDNSNLVFSPRKSKVFLKKKPLWIEAVALFRYRRYVASLMLSTVVFAILFVAGWYISSSFSVKQAENDADLSLAFSSAEAADDFTGYFANRAEHYGISPYVLEKSAANPFESLDENSSQMPPHLAIPEQKALSAEFFRHPQKSGYRAATALEIRAFDEEALKCLTDVYHYVVSGQPEKLLTDPYAIIVSSDLANAPGCTLLPGDIVYMPVRALQIHEVTGDLLQMLTPEMRMANTVFFYRAFTVAAVVENYSDYDDMLVYLPVCTDENGDGGYAAVMGTEPVYSQIRVHLSNRDDLTQVTAFTQAYVDNVGGVSFRYDYGALRAEISAAKNLRTLIAALSCLILAVSPLAGFFSQILFYEKRRLEFDVIRAVGGTKKTVGTMLLFDAAVFSLLSGALYSLGSVGLVHLLASLFNRPFLFALFGSAGAAGRFAPVLPAIPFVVGLVLTMLFPVLQILVCYRRYAKETDEHVAKRFSADDGV